MGWKITPELLKLMSPDDQARYGPPGIHPQANYGPGIHPPNDPHPPVKTDGLERDEQRSFANWCMLNDLPVVWHSTAHRSKASLGCPDFILGLGGQTFWIEFKRAGFHLSPDQEDFLRRLTKQRITLFICYTALEAIELCKPYIGELTSGA